MATGLGSRARDEKFMVNTEEKKKDKREEEKRYNTRVLLKGGRDGLVLGSD